MTDDKIDLQSHDRYFTKCYHDFIDCDLLNGEEKIVYLILKRFLDIKLDYGGVYPKIEVIQHMTGWGKRKVIKYIDSLAKKGIIKKNRQGLNKPNVYILSDYPDLWIETAAEPAAEPPAEPPKKKELESDTDQSTLTSTQALKHIHKPTKDDITNQPKSQAAAERYTLDSLKKLYDYSTLMMDYQQYRDDIDTALSIIYDVVNTSKSTIRIGAEDKPTMVVSSRLLKLDPSDLIYAIERFNQQSERIKNVKGYLLTILYTAKEQAHLDRANLGHHNGDF